MPVALDQSHVFLLIHLEKILAVDQCG